MASRSRCGAEPLRVTMRGERGWGVFAVLCVAALVGSLLVALAASPAVADLVPFAFRVTRVVQVERPDNGSNGDWYVKVRFDSGPFHSGSVHTGADEWMDSTFTTTVDPSGPPIPITLQLWDYDTFANGDDDHADINPADQSVDLNLTFDPATQTFGGDVTPGLGIEQAVSQGDGDHGYPSTHDGTAERIYFEAAVGNGSFDTDGDGIPDSVERFGALDGQVVSEPLHARGEKGRWFAVADHPLVVALPCSQVTVQ